MQQSVRAYPQPFGINAAHLLGYLSPVTEDELHGPRPTATVGQRRVRPSAARASSRSTTSGCAACPATASRGRLDGRTIGDEASRGPARRHPGHLDRRQGPERGREAARRHDRDRPGHQRPRHRPQLRCRLRRRRGAGGRHRTGRRHGQPADVRPGAVGRRHHQEAARRALLEEGRDAAARPGHAGPVRAGLDLEAVHDRRRPHPRLRRRHPPRLLLGVPGGQPRLQELRVRRLRLHLLRPGPRGLVQHLLLPGRLRLLAAVRLRRGRRQGQGPVGRGGPGVRLRRRDRHRPAGRGAGTDRRPRVEARLLQVDEGLLLRHRDNPQDAEQDQRLRLHVRRASSASRATPTAPATPSTSPSARATPSSPRSSWPAATPRSPTAAPSTSRGSPRRSSPPTAP